MKKIHILSFFFLVSCFHKKEIYTVEIDLEILKIDDKNLLIYKIVNNDKYDVIIPSLSAPLVFSKVTDSKGKIVTDRSNLSTVFFDSFCEEYAEDSLLSHYREDVFVVLFNILDEKYDIPHDHVEILQEILVSWVQGSILLKSGDSYIATYCFDKWLENDAKWISFNWKLEDRYIIQLPVDWKYRMRVPMRIAGFNILTQDLNVEYDIARKKIVHADE